MFPFSDVSYISKRWRSETIVNEIVFQDIDLTEYVGYVMTKEEYLEKLRFRCLFNNLETSYFGMQLTNDFYVDARNYGNVARSFNHSCEPNTKVVAVTVCTFIHYVDSFIAYFVVRVLIRLFFCRLMEFTGLKFRQLRMSNKVVS